MAISPKLSTLSGDQSSPGQQASSSCLRFREAKKEDLPSMAELLADDKLGQSRDGPQHMEAYAAAFAAIQAQKGNTIIIAELGDEVVGMMQLTLIPGLSHAGAVRGQIESVRVSSRHRGKRIGEALLQHTIHLAKQSGCSLVQLTTDKQRPEALRFYERYGFKPTHEGLKLKL